MLTEFGKALRKIRIDHQILLKEMADKLNVSSAFLSAVETGKRNMRPGWPTEIAKLFCLTQVEEKALEEAAIRTTTEVKISLEDASDVKRDTVMSFAKALDGLSDEDLSHIMAVVNRTKRGDVKRASR